ncbi:MAG: hypothetical protein CM15mP109_03300 [Candidatus Dadabacteria bacterium]|nr:MAG: hypothetical protein CM15mP109_03300 [Candidatus Dadabacteria bacterium]
MGLNKAWKLFWFFGTLIIIWYSNNWNLYCKTTRARYNFSLQSKLAQGKQALPEIVEGLALLIGALFFIIPGAITDIFGIILIIPSFRKFLLKLAVNKIIDELRKRENRY